MAQNVLLKYGDTSIISGETVQQGKILIDTQKAEISIDKDGTNRIKLTPTVDSALSTTSTNPVQNKSLTTSIINTAAEVKAITADYVPCGTKPVKELITNLPIYNPVTDSLDIYSAGVLVGSIPCHFQSFVIIPTTDISKFTKYADTNGVCSSKVSLNTITATSGNYAYGSAGAIYNDAMNYDFADIEVSADGVNPYLLILSSKSLTSYGDVTNVIARIPLTNGVNSIDISNYNGSGRFYAFGIYNGGTAHIGTAAFTNISFR